MTCFAKVMYTAGCCGVRQIVDILTHEGGNHDEDNNIMFQVEEATWPEVLTEIQAEEGSGYIFQVWFAEHCDYNGERAGHFGAGAELRELVRAIPDVVSLGEFKNPNSGNFIDGYQWVNP